MGAAIFAERDFEMTTKTATADAKFLHRIFLTLVFLTTIAGGMVGFTTVQATSTNTGSACSMFCE